jgi:hypothetical protein
MAGANAAEDVTLEYGEVEFFGVKLKVRNPRLAALLNSDVTEDVQVVGRRARDAVSGVVDEPAPTPPPRALHEDGSVSLRLDDEEV